MTVDAQVVFGSVSEYVLSTYYVPVFFWVLRITKQSLNPKKSYILVEGSGEGKGNFKKK